MNARASGFQIYGVPLLLIVAVLTIVPTLINTGSNEQRDFSAFILSARALRLGLDPYRNPATSVAPNANPPAFLLAVLPLTFMADGAAFGWWTAAAILGLVASLGIIARALKLSFTRLLMIALGLQSVSASIRFGQVTLLLLPMMTLAWLADRDGRPASAGAWLGGLIYMKPFVGIFALYMLWRREWRALQTLIAVYVALSIIGLLAGFRATLSWIETVRGLSEKTAHVVNASWFAIPARVLSVDRSEPSPVYTPFVAAPAVALFISAAGVLAIAVVSIWAIRRQKNRDRHWAILGASMLLVSPLGWMYYIPLLIPPLAATVPELQHLGPILVAGAMLWVPSSVLARNHFGPLASATIASPYTWGLLLIWATISFERDTRQ